jgi:ribonuclease-3 family protein
LGDGVYELFVRELAVAHVQQSASNRVEDLHRYTTHRASASFQAQLMEALMPQLIEAEREMFRRGRNMQVSAGRRSNQALHRQASGFEALMGYLHLAHPDRLKTVFEVMTPWLLDPATMPKAAETP